LRSRSTTARVKRLCPICACHQNPQNIFLLTALSYFLNNFCNPFNLISSTILAIHFILFPERFLQFILSAKGNEMKNRLYNVIFKGKTNILICLITQPAKLRFWIEIWINLYWFKNQIWLKTNPTYKIGPIFVFPYFTLCHFVLKINHVQRDTKRIGSSCR